MTSRTSISTYWRWLVHRFPHWRGSRGAGAVVMAAVLFTTACAGADPGQGGASSAGAVSVSASPTASATPTPTASYKPADASGKAENVPVPVLPEAAKAETKEGLEAFARYWFQLLSYGYETGDTSRLEPITSSVCAACERAKAVITAWHADGRWLTGGKTDTPSVSTTFRVAPDGNYQVAIQVSQSALSYFNADGTAHRSDTKPDDTGNLMLAVFRDGSWYVNNIQPIVG